MKHSIGTVKTVVCFFSLLFFFPAVLVFAQTPRADSFSAHPLRSFDELFPALDASRKDAVFGAGGLIRSEESFEALLFTPARYSGINLTDAIREMKPSYIAESLLVLPYGGKTLGRLDLYNALGKISDLKGRLYHSHTRDADVPLFEDATRIEGENSARAIPDPPPSGELPAEETVYIRLKDVNFGNTYYRGYMSTSSFGVTYKLSNTKNLSYLVFPVMKTGKFSALLYLEPLAEGILVYSMAGAGASDFIASMVDIPSAISKRLAVFIGWISDGIRAAE